MNPGSPVLNNQYQNTPGVITNDILFNIQTYLESMHKKLGQLAFVIVVSELVLLSMENSSHVLRNTVDEIVSDTIELNDGIDLISKHLNNISSKIFGETKQFKQYKYRRKFIKQIV